MVSMMFIKLIIKVFIVAIYTSMVFGSFLFRPTEIMINDARLVNQDVVHSYLEWIAAESPYPIITPNNPDIRFANKAFMKKEWISNGGEYDISIAAMTVVDKNTRKIIIYLEIGFDWENPRHLAFLLHELVHFQQYTYSIDIDTECNNVLENEAYVLELRWFVKQNVNDDVFIKHRAKRINETSGCS